MDWRVHGIGANRAFEQFMNAGGGSNSRRRLWRRQLIIRIVMIVRMMVGLDLFIFQATRRGYALNVIYIHYKSKEFWWIPSIFQGFPLVSSFSWIRLEKEEPQEVGTKMGRERERDRLWRIKQPSLPPSLSLSSRPNSNGEGDKRMIAVIFQNGSKSNGGSKIRPFNPFFPVQFNCF